MRGVTVYDARALRPICVDQIPIAIAPARSCSFSDSSDASRACGSANLKGNPLHGGIAMPHRPHPRTAPAHAALPWLAGLVACLFAANGAHADSGHSRDREVRFTGPLVSSSPPLPKGLLNVEPYLINTQVVGTYDG